MLILEFASYTFEEVRERIKGKKNDYFRIRLGGWRVVYAVINRKIVVINTLLSGSQGDVYKKMDGLK